MSATCLYDAQHVLERLHQVEGKLFARQAEFAEHRSEVEQAIERLSETYANHAQLGDDVTRLEAHVARASELACCAYDWQQEFIAQNCVAATGNGAKAKSKAEEFSQALRRDVDALTERFTGLTGRALPELNRALASVRRDISVLQEGLRGVSGDQEPARPKAQQRPDSRSKRRDLGGSVPKRPNLERCDVAAPLLRQLHESLATSTCSDSGEEARAHEPEKGLRSLSKAEDVVTLAESLRSLLSREASEKAVEQVRAELNEASAERASHAARIDDAEQLVAQVQSQLERQHDEVSQLGVRVEAAHAAATVLHEHSVEGLAAHFRQEATRLESDCAARLESAVGTLHGHRDLIEELQESVWRRVGELECEMSSLSAQLSKAAAQAGSAQPAAEALAVQEGVVSLQRDHAELKASLDEVAGICKQVSDVAAQAQGSQQAVAALDKRLVALHRDHAELRSSMSAQLSEVAAQAGSSQPAADALGGRLASLQQDHAELKGSLDEVAGMCRRHDEAASQARSSRQAVNALSDRFAALQRDHAELRLSLEETRSMIPDSAKQAEELSPTESRSLKRPPSPACTLQELADLRHAVSELQLSHGRDAAPSPSGRGGVARDVRRELTVLREELSKHLVSESRAAAATQCEMRQELFEAAEALDTIGAEVCEEQKQLQQRIESELADERRTVHQSLAELSSRMDQLASGSRWQSRAVAPPMDAPAGGASRADVQRELAALREEFGKQLAGESEAAAATESALRQDLLQAAASLDAIGAEVCTENAQMQQRIAGELAERHSVVESRLEELFDEVEQLASQCSHAAALLQGSSAARSQSPGGRLPPADVTALMEEARSETRCTVAEAYSELRQQWQGDLAAGLSRVEAEARTLHAAAVARASDAVGEVEAMIGRLQSETSKWTHSMVQTTGGRLEEKLATRSCGSAQVVASGVAGGSSSSTGGSTCVGSHDVRGETPERSGCEGSSRSPYVQDGRLEQRQEESCNDVHAATLANALPASTPASTLRAAAPAPSSARDGLAASASIRCHTPVRSCQARVGQGPQPVVAAMVHHAGAASVSPPPQQRTGCVVSHHVVTRRPASAGRSAASSARRGAWVDVPVTTVSSAAATPVAPGSPLSPPLAISPESTASCVAAAAPAGAAVAAAAYAGQRPAATRRSSAPPSGVRYVTGHAVRQAVSAVPAPSIAGREALLCDSRFVPVQPKAAPVAEPRGAADSRFVSSAAAASYLAVKSREPRAVQHRSS